MAGKTKSSWTDLKDALKEWHDSRIDKANKQIKEDAKNLKNDIIRRIESTAAEGQPAATASLSSKATETSEAKEARLSAAGQTNKPTKDNKSKNPLSGLDTYAQSIIIDDESNGDLTVQVVKIDDMTKKDETTGLPLVKIAKAVEFGTTNSAPRSSWRRSLKKIRDTGAYKEPT